MPTLLWEPSIHPAPGGQPEGLSGPSSLWLPRASGHRHGNGEMGGCFEISVGPRPLVQAATPILGPGTLLLHGWAAAPRAQCPGLKTLCSRQQSRKHLCLCLWFLYTSPTPQPCVLALAFPYSPQVPLGPPLEADPCSGHSRAGALEPSAMCSQLHATPRPAPPPMGVTLG